MTDETFIRRALELAERGRGLASPHPLVGAVVVAAGGVVGEGWHEGPGTQHAEAAALRAAGSRARGATLYSTLEPCDHYGRTPPCSVAIADAGVSRVVVSASRDPHPLVNGRGIERLRELGLDVVEGPLAELAQRQNEAYFKQVRSGMPFVTLKVAATLDGRVAARDGSSRWITGPEARMEAHRMRGAADAVMVGAGTVLADDPSLTVRDPAYRGDPVLRVVVDARGRVPPERRVFSAEAPTLVATTHAASRERVDAWARTGAEVLLYDAEEGCVPLRDLVGDLGKRDVQLLLLEGGPTLAWGAVREGIVDKIVLFLAPLLVGGAAAPGVLGGDGFAPVGRALHLRITATEAVGPDLKVEAYVHRDR